VIATGESVSHYRILEKLGGGGMGVVYKAEDTRLGRTVALKVLPPERVADPNRKRRFIQEARAASALNHPNIITIYDIDEADGVHFIAMEYVDGKTLDRLIAHHGLPVEKTLKYAVEMAAALTKAHSAGIVHRDLKPTNIMVTEDGLVKVLDFGLAKLTEAAVAPVSPPVGGDEDPSAALRAGAAATAAETLATAGPRTEEGIILGTVGYMSPEQAEGKPVDARSDIFSFGSVLYEMLTGRRAFQGETNVSTIAAILREEPKPLSQVSDGLPHEVERLVKRCLRKDREHRFQHMDDVKVALEELKEESDSGELAKAAAVAAGLSRQPESGGIKPPLRRWAVWAIAGAAAVVAVGLAVAWIVTHRTPPPAPQITERRLTANPSEIPLSHGAISPDGKYLGYADALGLHLKLIQSGETLDIPQPEGPGVPSTGSWWPNAWFPDGTKFIVGAFAPNQPVSAWAVSVMGGPPRKLRDDADPWSVSPDGKLIAFGTGTAFIRSREIWLMGAQGEDARKFLSGSDDDAFFWAAWSPDGQRIAYKRFHRTPDGQECSIESRDLKGGQPTLISSGPALCGGGKFVWTSEGRFIYLVIERDHKGVNLWEIRVDASTGRPLGSPRRVTNWEGAAVDHLSVTRDGRQLAVNRGSVNADVYVAELEGNGRHLKSVRRLTLDDNNDVPSQWMPDGKAVLFRSDRNGTWDLFKQRLDQTDAEPVVTGPGVKESPVVSPDGSWILYLSSPNAQMTSTTPVRIMRVPISGGAPQLVLEGRGISRLACAHSPATDCVFSEPSADSAHLVFSAFDPNRGLRRELTRTSLRPSYLSSSGGPVPYNDWDLSWDGTRLAFAQFDLNERRIQILPLAGGPARDVVVEGSSGIGSVRWAADGKGLWVGVSGYASSRRPLLHVDLQGRAEVLWQQTRVGAGWTVAVPSADGRHLAMLGVSGSYNVWLLEGF
jgi:Tol biopolymer transport system component/predicted Ser/Thr protein kinase